MQSLAVKQNSALGLCSCGMCHHKDLRELYSKPFNDVIVEILTWLDSSLFCLGLSVQVLFARLPRLSLRIKSSQTTRTSWDMPMFESFGVFHSNPVKWCRPVAVVKVLVKNQSWNYRMYTCSDCGIYLMDQQHTTYCKRINKAYFLFHKSNVKSKPCSSGCGSIICQWYVGLFETPPLAPPATWADCVWASRCVQSSWARMRRSYVVSPASRTICDNPHAVVTRSRFKRYKAAARTSSTASKASPTSNTT